MTAISHAFRGLFLGAAVTAASAPAALLAAPKVVADIPPLHAITAAVMEGVGAPTLLIDGDAGAHDFALRPSQARALQGADLIVWAGPALNPALEKPIESLAGDAAIAELLSMPGTHLLERRGEFFSHEGAGDGAREHADEAAEHAQDAAVDGHGHGEEEDTPDPHAWLDPRNAAIWGTGIAARLAELDPQNADRYAANAERFAARIEALDARLSKRLAPLGGQPLLVGHDAWQYLERRYGLSVVGAVSLSDAADPGPARLAALRDTLAMRAPACVLDEPGRGPALWKTVIGEGDVRVVTVDPAGGGLAPGAALYETLMDRLVDALADCLAPR